MKQKERVKKRKESQSMAGIMSRYGGLFTTANNPDLQTTTGGSGSNSAGGSMELSFAIPTAESTYNFSSDDYVPFSPGALMSPGTRLDHEIRLEEEAAARAAAAAAAGKTNPSPQSHSGFLPRNNGQNGQSDSQPRPGQPRLP